MTVDVLIQRLREYSLTVLVNKAQSWMAKFAIGAGFEASVGKIDGFIRSFGCVDSNGNVDVEALERVIKSGFQSAGHLDVFGGLVGFDLDDVDGLFTYLKTTK